MSQIYIGNLDRRVTERDIRREFQQYGRILSVRVPQRPPGGYAFVEFVDVSDALEAIGAWDGKYGWRVELSRDSQWLLSVTSGPTGRVGGGSSSNLSDCFRCGQPGHFARDCLFTFDKKNKGVKSSDRLSRGRKKKDLKVSTSVWKPVSPPPPPWLELPEDIMAKILKNLGPFDLLKNVQRVCTSWRRICKDPAMWRVIDLFKFDIHQTPGGVEMCRHAITLSQGELLEINIKYFGDDEFLDYIAQRAPQLRCIRLAHCEGLSVEGITKAFKQLPLLEELQLQSTPILGEDIEDVGQSCPALKSFIFNKGYFRSLPFRECDDEEALAIAKSMPQLCRLRLVGNSLTNEGLRAILDACPNLESLDLRRCLNIRMEGELGKRCQRIKDLRRPNDVIDPFDTDWDEVPGCGDFFRGFTGSFAYDYMHYDDELDYDMLYADYCSPYGYSDDSDDDIFFEDTPF